MRAIGRRSSLAISLVSPEEMDHFKVIRKKMGKRVKPLSGDQIDLQGY